MTKKGYLGITALIVFVIAVGGFIYWQLASVEQLKEQADQDANRLEEAHKPEQPSEANKPPRKARAGFKWEWHGDHWHEMPIAQAPQQTPQQIPQVQPVVTYTGPLTYHEELLKTNPVEALRLQSEERGHVNAKWIPPFPPDDKEAQDFARSIYLFIYNMHSKNPIHIDGVENGLIMSRRYNEKYGRISARGNDLHKLTWVELDFPMNHYRPSGHAMFASDYFPGHISNLK